jgi:hypothetical protein
MLGIEQGISTKHECPLLVRSGPFPGLPKISAFGVPPQPVDATQALNLSAGVN